jgi:choline dehydrogenase-like flavoprotein
LTGAPRTYDYIVVGGGSAGSIVAARLSERADRSVLLIEAGGWDRHWYLRVPLGAAKAWNHPRWNWSYRSAPEPGMNGRVVFHPRGKVIGGSGSINIMAFVRGHPREYEHWAQSGLSDWSWEKVLPYFKRLETFTDGESEARGGSGPIRVVRREGDDVLIGAWLSAGQQAGHAFNPDYNGAEQEGVSVTQSNIGEGRRQSAAASYLRPALRRPNLDVATHAEVQRLLLDGGRVRGVAFERDGESHTARATQEVILCAGAYNTPKLLMLSGIGPAAHLREHAIDVVLDVAGVGENLQDHPTVLIEYAAARASAFQRNLRWDRLTLSMLQAQLFRTGPAARSLSLGMAFLKSEQRLDIPDIQLIFRPFARDARPWFPGLAAPFEDRLGLVVCHLRPAARGSLRLASTSHRDPPVILNRFFEHESDLRALRKGVRLARDIARQPAFSNILGAEALPGAAVSSDAEIDSYIRGTAATLFHPCGTCRMGSDANAVVDEDLRFRGIEGLRIADASVMPAVVGGNINACVMMIAEKAAELIAAT